MYQAGPGAAGEEEAGRGAGGRGGGRHHRPRHGGRMEKRGQNSILVGLLQRYTEITHGPFSLVMRKEYFDCPQRDSYAVH
jgi:hypothetical protein